MVFILFLLILFGGLLNKHLKIANFRKFLNAIEYENDSDYRVQQINRFFIENARHPLSARWDAYYGFAIKSKEVPDFYEYINENYVLESICRKKLIDMVPGILISLGILGTFLGLYDGLKDLDGFSSDESMSSAIESLLAGVRIAFQSSLFGIFLSIVWLVLEKLYFDFGFNPEMNRMIERLNLLLPKVDDEVYLKEMVNIQKENLDTFRTIVTDTLIPDLISGIDRAMSEAIIPHLKHNQEALDRNNETLVTMSENVARQQSESLNSMVDTFLDSLNQATGDHFVKLGESLDKVIEWNEKMYNNTSQLVESLAQNSELQINTGAQLVALSNEFNEVVDRLTKAQFELNSTIEELNDAQFNMVEMQQEVATAMEQASIRQHELDELQAGIRTSLTEQLDEFDNRIDKLTEHWHLSEKNLAAVNEQLETSMEHFVSNMHDGLDRTFNQFDENLKQAVQYLQTGVVNLGDATADLPTIVENFQNDLKSLRVLNKELIDQYDKYSQLQLDIDNKQVEVTANLGSSE